MGASFSFLSAERKTWIEHNLVFNHSVREENLKILDNFMDGTDIFLAYSESKWGGLEFEHWFITDKTYFVEFGSPSLDIYTACVTISTYSNREYSIDPTNRAQKCKMNGDIRQRMSHVLGMSNYSLCLRNCEHVANYIFRGRWVSHQMDLDDGSLMNYFKNKMLGSDIRLVNSFPACIRPHVFSGSKEKQVYSFVNDHFRASQFSYYLDSNEKTFNILVVGPTGAGKSHLINVFFNETICESMTSHHSVTREIYFIRGQGEIYDIKKQRFEQKNIVVADTIGLCDTEWNDDQVIQLIKGRVSSNIRFIDTVFIVFRADRLSPQHIKNIKRILDWLEYEKNYLRIKIVSTFADYLSVEKKEELRQEAIKIFGVEQTVQKSMVTWQNYNTLIYTGFPPEEALNKLTRTRLEACWNELKMVMTLPGACERIEMKKQHRTCSIL